MTSLINPNNIDGAYPVAGQDNNSQGFRDNFTNTKTNFQYASEEITDLQNKAVLKSALTGSVLNNNMNGSILSDVQLQDASQTRVALGTLSGSITLNYAAGSYQTVTTSGSISLNLINFPPAGAQGILSLQITVASTSHQVTLPVAVSINTNGITGLSTATNIMTFAATGTYTLQLSTSDGGSSYVLNQTNNILTPFNHSFDQQTSGSAASLLSTASFVNTAGSGQTATLANGVNGQVKIFAMVSDGGGNMVITVATAGWKTSGSGTITLSSIGQTVTLRYMSDKWFVIGLGPDQSGTVPTFG
jgi:hypothetical protein